MTRWHGTTKADRVLADGGADGARGGRRADFLGDPRIGGDPAHRDFQQRLPHPHLPIGADQHDAQRPVLRAIATGRRCAARSARCARHPRHSSRVGQRRFMSASAASSSPGSAKASPARPRSVAITSAVAERRGVKAEMHRQPFAARFPFARRHRFVGDEQIVQPARAGQADLIGGVEHARRIAQQLPRAVERERLQERLRREPRPAAEQMMQLGRGDAGGFGDGFDLGLVAPMIADVSDGAAHDARSRRRRAASGVRSGMRSGESMAVSIICTRSRPRAAPNHPFSEPAKAPGEA